MNIRCPWAKNDRLKKYHDEEWGIPIRDDRKLHEFMLLEAFQSGLSWDIVLAKRKNFQKAFDNFRPDIIAKYNDDKFEKLMNNLGIIRNKLKIKATITNAQAFLKVQDEFGKFDSYIWKFTNGKTIVNRWRTDSEIPATSQESDQMSKDLRKRGFKFAGSTICYAFMQGTGMVNDHIVSCFRYS